MMKRLLFILILLSFLLPRSDPPPRHTIYIPLARTDHLISVAFLPVPVDRARAGNADEIRAAFLTLKALNVNIVAQEFHPATTENDWRTYLDLAHEANLSAIIAFLDAPPVRSDTDFDLGINGAFLAAMQDHPALYAFLLIDEPFHQRHNPRLTTGEMQSLYSQARSIAPSVPIMVQWSRMIWKAENGLYGPNHRFKRGMCDICAISTLEFRNYGQGNFFDRETAIANHSVSRAVIRREDPEARIWATMQVFGSVATTEGQPGGSTYYMPDAGELRSAIELILSDELQQAGRLEAISWQAWASRQAGQYTLGDAEFGKLRRVVAEVGK